MAAPDMVVWAKYLARRIATTPTDFQGHEDVPEDAALALVEALEPGDLARLCDALLEAAPGLREHFSDLLLTELKEEIVRQEDGRHSRATVTLIEQIEEDWRRDA